MSRITTDTTLLQTLIGSSVSLAARNALTLVGALILMSLTNIKLTLIMLIGVPLTLLPVLYLGRRVRNLSNKSQASIASVGNRAGGASIHQIVQSFQRETMERDVFEQEVSRAFDIAKKRIQQRAWLMACAIFLFLGGMVGMMWTGGQDVIAGRMSGGDLGPSFSTPSCWVQPLPHCRRCGVTCSARRCRRATCRTPPSGERYCRYGLSPIRMVRRWLPRASALPIQRLRTLRFLTSI